MVRTDQLGERIRVSVGLWSQKLVWQVRLVIQISGILIFLLGTYLFFSKALPAASLLGAEPSSQILIAHGTLDGLTLIFAGLIIAWIFN